MYILIIYLIIKMFNLYMFNGLDQVFIFFGNKLLNLYLSVTVKTFTLLQKKNKCIAMLNLISAVL